MTELERIEHLELINDNERLRQALIDIGRKVGCLLANTVSTGFIVDNVPGELAHTLKAKRAEGYAAGIACAAEVCYHDARLAEMGAPSAHPYASVKTRQLAATILALASTNIAKPARGTTTIARPARPAGPPPALGVTVPSASSGCVTLRRSSSKN
jgi:hypothetical protein